jgi:gamma-glutamyltranspeptidase/glutathione hydrolase
VIADAAEPPVARGTSHISVVDANGGAASMTCSTGCGSGVVAGDTGVHLNNMLGELDLHVPGVRLVAGDRLTSMMAPSLVVGADGVQLVLGSSGSARIRSAIVQVALHAQRRGLDASEAVRLPRLHPEGDVLDLEGGFPDGTAEALEALGERVQRWPGLNLYFGGAQVVTRHQGRLSGGGDPRRGGDAVVLG